MRCELYLRDDMRWICPRRMMLQFVKNKGIPNGSNGGGNAGAFPPHSILNVRMVLDEIEPEEKTRNEVRCTA